MQTYYQALDVAINNLKRLNRLRIKGKLLSREDKDSFKLYQQIVRANDTGVYTNEVKTILNVKL